MRISNVHDISYIENYLDNFAVKLKNHQALKSPFFEYLQEQEGFNSCQYRIFRDNFFYRTAFTIPGVLHVIKSAILFGNYDAAWHVGRNIIDELGHNNQEFSSSNNLHLKLLEDSFNEFGTVLFDIEKISIANSENSSYLIPQALSDRKVRQVLYESRSAVEVFATSWAHEFAADDMLINFFDDIFLPYNRNYDDIKGNGSFKIDIAPYFDAHRDDSKENGDVEAEHERIARNILANMLQQDSTNILKSFNMVEAAVLMFLDSQTNLWTGIMNAMKESKNKALIIDKSAINLPTKASQKACNIQ